MTEKELRLGSISLRKNTQGTPSFVASQQHLGVEDGIRKLTDLCNHFSFFFFWFILIEERVLRVRMVGLVGWSSLWGILSGFDGSRGVWLLRNRVG